MRADSHQNDLFRVIQESPWFLGLPASALQYLADAAQLKSFSANDYLYRLGEVTSSIYCLMSGRIRISMRSPMGQEFTLTDLDPEYWLGEASILGDTARLQEAQILSPAKILVIPRALVLQVGENHPLLYRNLFSQSLERSRQIYELMAGMVFYPLRVRLAGRLLSLIGDYGVTTDEGTYLDVQLSQNDFARLCLGSRQRINKIFRQWTEQGILEMQADRYMIFDVAALQREISLEEL